MTRLTDSDLKLFHDSVWEFVCTVPVGRVVTYGQVAQAVVPPSSIGSTHYQREGARLVGAAMAACPDSVPWHRVVNARGRLSGHATAERQCQRLLLEGVEVVAGQLDLLRVQWHGKACETVHPQASLF